MVMSSFITLQKMQFKYTGKWKNKAFPKVRESSSSNRVRIALSLDKEIIIIKRQNAVWDNRGVFGYSPVFPEKMSNHSVADNTRIMCNLGITNRFVYILIFLET